MNAIIKKDQYLEDTKKLFQAISESFLELGERLYRIFTEEIWREKYDLYEEFLEDMGISPAQASKMRQIYEHYVLKLGYEDKSRLAIVPWTSLYSAISLAKDKASVDRIIDRVEKNQYRRQDIDDDAREARGGECKHKNTYKIEVCRGCGKKWGI